MRLRFFGGFAVEDHDATVTVRGRGQEALLFRLALDTGTTVRYRALAEDVWPDDPPEDPRAALQSLVSRLRRALPAGTLEAAPGGYRLTLARDAVDLTEFQDLVAAARRAPDPAQAATLACAAVALWRGDPWTPGDAFDWVISDLFEDRGHAERLLRAVAAESAQPATELAMVPSAPVSSALAPPAPAAGSAPAAPASASAFAPATVPGQAVLAPAAIAPATMNPAAIVPASKPAELTGSVPAALTSLVGRLDELELIEAQLATERLVTLIGPGGAGKTTLAQESARRRPGSVMVELAPAGPDEVWAAVAGVVGRTIRLADSPAAPVTARERALEALAGRRLLVVLDNCEHVSESASAVALDLLRELPGTQLLATSREPLGLPGEAFVDLGPLPEADAIELFARRVRAARGRPPASTEADVAASIVRRLDGLPLALELAAARSRSMSLAEIDSGLDDRFALLASGPRAADPRHQTLRALIDWSWETLSDAERTALLTVSVFPDGLGAGDIPVIAGHFGSTADAFERLVDRSLLRRVAGRLRMLETVREYGLDRLRTDGDEARFQTRQARAVSQLAATSDALLRGPQVREGLAWFDANEENVGVALRTTAADDELRSVGVHVLRASLWAWMMRERFDDLQSGLATFASVDAPVDSEAAVVVHGLGFLVEALSAALAAERMGETGSTAQPVGPGPDGEQVVDASGTVSRLSARVADLTRGARRFPSELASVIPVMAQAATSALAEPAGPAVGWSRRLIIPAVDSSHLPRWSQAFLSLLRAVMAQNSGDLPVLGAESEQAQRMFEELEDVWGIALACQMRSEWLMLQGRLEEALTTADRACEGLRGLTSASDLIQQLTLGLSILLRLGRMEQARERLAEIWSIARTDESERALQQAAMAAASFAIAAGDGAAALRHLDTVPLGSAPFMDQLVAWDGALRARALLLCDRPDDAREALRPTLAVALRSGDQPIIADSILTLAQWLAATGQQPAARRALASSVRLRGGLDAHEPSLARLVAQIGPPDPRDADSDDLSGLIGLLG